MLSTLSTLRDTATDSAVFDVGTGKLKPCEDLFMCFKFEMWNKF